MLRSRVFTLQIGVEQLDRLCTETLPLHLTGQNFQPVLFIPLAVLLLTLPSSMFITREMHGRASK